MTVHSLFMSPPPSSTPTLSIYLVEDSATIRDNLSETFAELLNARVCGWADTSALAIAWLHSHPNAWSLLVVDLFLRRGNGMDVLAALRTLPRHAMRQRVFVLSNYATPAMREACLSEGADAVYDKSTELDQMLAACEAFASSLTASPAASN